MTDRLRVILEIGRKRRVVASAMAPPGRPTRTRPIQLLVRRTAHHVMDHAWELEDRDLGALSAP